MIRPATPLNGFSLQASDGEIGKVKDLYFDGQHWQLRYFVVETGHWLKQRRVLISPESVAAPAWDQRTLPVTLTKDQIRKSPDWDSDRPVSRQYETALRNYYAWPPYWGPLYGNVGTGLHVAPPVTPLPLAGEEKEPGDPALFSCDAVRGIHVLASDGEIGHVDDFLLDDRHWGIRYLVVDTRNWWPGKKVLLSPWWSSEIDRPAWQIRMDLTREAIKASPPYDPSRPITAKESGELHDYYGRTRHRDDEIGEAVVRSDHSTVP